MKYTDFPTIPNNKERRKESPRRVGRGFPSEPKAVRQVFDHVGFSNRRFSGGVLKARSSSVSAV
jgi:hypothetical protein